MSYLLSLNPCTISLMSYITLYYCYLHPDRGNLGLFLHLFYFYYCVFHSVSYVRREKEILIWKKKILEKWRSEYEIKKYKNRRIRITTDMRSRGTRVFSWSLTSLIYLIHLFIFFSFFCIYSSWFSYIQSYFVPIVLPPPRRYFFSLFSSLLLYLFSFFLLPYNQSISIVACASLV